MYLVPLKVSIKREPGFTQGCNERNIWYNSWSHQRIKWSHLLCHTLSIWSYSQCHKFIARSHSKCCKWIMHAIYSHTHNLGKSSCRLIWFQYIEPLHVLLILSYLQDLASLKVPYMEQLISLMLSQIMHLISQMILLLCALRRSSKYQFHSFWSDSTWARTHDLQHSK